LATQSSGARCILALTSADEQSFVNMIGRKTVTQRSLFALIGLPAFVVFAVAHALDTSVAQQKTIKDQLVGAWTLVAVAGEHADGSKFEPFGHNPKGIIIFSDDGHFSLFQSSAEVSKIAANDRAKATTEEATAIVRESIAYYGTYEVNEGEKTLSVKLNGSTYANLIGGPEQKRIVTSLTPEELKFTNPRTPAGVTLLTAWKRAKSP